MGLGKRRYHVVVIASRFSHFTHEYIMEKGYPVKVSELSEHVHYIYLRTSAYVTNGGVGRAKNMIDFIQKVLKYERIIARLYGKSDVVTGCTICPLAWVAAYEIPKNIRQRLSQRYRIFGRLSVPLPAIIWSMKAYMLC